MIDIAGHPRGNGNPHDMAAAPAASDAPVVTALREAGADVFATTSLLEYAAGATHPECPRRATPSTPAAPPAAPAAARPPSSAPTPAPWRWAPTPAARSASPPTTAGSSGFKPSFGAIDVTGVQPLSRSLDHVGILGADVAITARVFAALTGQAPADRPVTLRLGVARPQMDHPAIQPGVAAALRGAVERLGQAFPVVDVDGSALTEIAGAFDDILLWEAWQVHRGRVEAYPERYGPETLRLLRTAAKVSEDTYQTACRRRDDLLPRAAQVYRGIDVLLTPAAPFTAPATTPPVDTPEGALEGCSPRRST